MRIKVEDPARVVAYGVYGTGSDGRPIAYKGGELVEYVDVLVSGEESSRRIKLHQSINGTRAEVGSEVLLTLDLVRRSDVAYRQDGSAYAIQKDRLTVLAMEPFKAKAGAAS